MAQDISALLRLSLDHLGLAFPLLFIAKMVETQLLVQTTLYLIDFTTLEKFPCHSSNAYQMWLTLTSSILPQ